MCSERQNGVQNFRGRNSNAVSDSKEMLRKANSKLLTNLLTKSFLCREEVVKGKNNRVIIRGKEIDKLYYIEYVNKIFALNNVFESDGEVNIKATKVRTETCYFTGYRRITGYGETITIPSSLVSGYCLYVDACFPFDRKTYTYLVMLKSL
eukprot:gb/GECH01008712.1/.p1 GENE.gb/GECH01008712.1/~~gb/GECH01008712.1/.p1  ORF type:complete len:151 (+),score=16.34 gb/GECH01008712.1/:1-453(+)